MFEFLKKLTKNQKNEEIQKQIRQQELNELVELGKKYLPVPENMNAEIGSYCLEFFSASYAVYVKDKDKRGYPFWTIGFSASSVEELKQKLMNPDEIEELKNKYIINQIKNENPIDFCKNCEGYKAGKCNKYLNVVDGMATECETNRKDNSSTCLRYVPNVKLVNAMKKKIKFKSVV